MQPTKTSGFWRNKIAFPEEEQEEFDQLRDVMTKRKDYTTYKAAALMAPLSPVGALAKLPMQKVFDVVTGLHDPMSPQDGTKRAEDDSEETAQLVSLDHDRYADLTRANAHEAASSATASTAMTAGSQVEHLGAKWQQGAAQASYKSATDLLERRSVEYDAMRGDKAHILGISGTSGLVTYTFKVVHGQRLKLDIEKARQFNIKAGLVPCAHSRNFVWVPITCAQRQIGLQLRPHCGLSFFCLAP